mmetsp:Transcript_52007/g.144021  ORF Transcript_52007/g.144021 Transcript_52007/m.144021 type:complete len:216 (+) Transcript_52007:479-1126(+)
MVHQPLHNPQHAPCDLVRVATDGHQTHQDQEDCGSDDGNPGLQNDEKPWPNQGGQGDKHTDPKHKREPCCILKPHWVKVARVDQLLGLVECREERSSKHLRHAAQEGIGARPTVELPGKHCHLLTDVGTLSREGGFCHRRQSEGRGCYAPGDGPSRQHGLHARGDGREKREDDVLQLGLNARNPTEHACKVRAWHSQQHRPEQEPRRPSHGEWVP